MYIEHQPVLLEACLQALAIKPQGYYIDATFGRGGHSLAILKKLNQQGRLIALDRDPEAVLYAKTIIQDDRFSVYHCEFSQLENILKELSLIEKIDGILFDLGVSSPQLDDASRGFSFSTEGPLDMRMNPEQGISVRTWLQKARAEEIADILFTYGEERFARRIAKAIVESKDNIKTTKDLVDIIVKAQPVKDKHKHPATRSFQALRIFINQELQEIETVLPQAVTALKPQGRLAIISFHSLEDRIVKRFLRNQANPDANPLKLPILPEKPLLKLLGKVKAEQQEIDQNPRARSALLRIAEKQG